MKHLIVYVVGALVVVGLLFGTKLYVDQRKQEQVMLLDILILHSSKTFQNILYLFYLKEKHIEHLKLQVTLCHLLKKVQSLLENTLKTGKRLGKGLYVLSLQNQKVLY